MNILIKAYRVRNKGKPLTLLTPIGPEVPLKSGVKGIPVFVQALMKYLDALDTVLKYPTRTGPSVPLTDRSTSGYNGSCVYFSNFLKYLDALSRQRNLADERGQEPDRLKFFHDQESSPITLAHSSKSPGAPYCALQVNQ